MRVLLIKTSALGDIIQTFPVVEYLKVVQGVEHIGWVVEESAEELVRSHPYVDEVIPIRSKAIRRQFPRLSSFKEMYKQGSNVRKETWDVAFDLQGNCKSAAVTWLARANIKVGWGSQTAPERIATYVLDHKFNPPEFLPMREQYLNIVSQYFQTDDRFTAHPISLKLLPSLQEQFTNEIARWPTDRPCWIISLGSRQKNKQCVVEEMAEALSALQKEMNIYFIFTAATIDELNAAGTCLKKLPHAVPGTVLYQLALPVVQHLVARSNRCISVDSMMLHLAATTQTPTFSFFGPSSAALYAPSHSLDKHLQGTCPYGMRFTKRCPYLRSCLTGACMKQMKARHIEDALRSWIQKNAS